MFRLCFCPILLLALFAAQPASSRLAPWPATAPGQEEAQAHHAGGTVGWVPREVLERPVQLQEGVGCVHEAVTTSSSQAQAFYDQGLAYLHSYVWIEAARSFHQALRLDPNLAMAYIGLSRAYTGLDDPAAARLALEKGQSLAGRASDREKRRMAIRAKQIEALADLGNSAKHLEYKKTLDEALAAHMDDAELWLLRGNAEEASAAGRGQRGGAASIAFYEAVLARSPGNFAAHHYLIHSFETIGQIPDALKHGEVYARAAPAVPHAHHMYGHDLRRVGRTEEAIATFRKAYALEKAYYQAENIPAAYDWHHKHNLDLLSTSYQHQGQMKMAEQLMREAFAIPGVTEYSEFSKIDWPGFLLARGRTEEALSAARTLTQSKWPLGRMAGHMLASRCLLALNRMDAAKEELAAAEKALEESRGSRASSGPPRTTAALSYVEALRGEILLRSGQRTEGATILKDVQRKIRAVPGPDAWIQALFVLESIAGTARQAGDWELAEYTARQMLDHDAAYAGSHYALALVSEHKGDSGTAQREFTQAERLWAKADPDLLELSQIRQRLALRGSR